MRLFTVTIWYSNQATLCSPIIPDSWVSSNRIIFFLINRNYLLQLPREPSTFIRPFPSSHEQRRANRDGDTAPKCREDRLPSPGSQAPRAQPSGRARNEPPPRSPGIPSFAGPFPFVICNRVGFTWWHMALIHTSFASFCWIYVRG